MFETCVIPLEDFEEGGDKFIIYRPLLGLAFIGNQAMKKMALELSSNAGRAEVDRENETIRFLGNIGFFLPDPPVPPNKASYTSVTLLMTNQCQLRCTYCYAAAGVNRPKFLKLETAKAAIDFASKQAIQENKKTFRLEFHGGGEPTLGWKTLQDALEYTRSLPIAAHISITSNAMWTQEQCQWLISHMDGLTISMDGAQITQDKNRPLASGEPSSSIVCRNLKTLDEKGVKYGIRMTAAAPWSLLPENVDYILTNTTCRNMLVEPAFNTDRGFHENGSPEEQRAFIDAYKQAYCIAREHQAQLHFPGARPDKTTNCFCTAPYDALVVNPDDQIVTCYEVSTSAHPLSPQSTHGRIVNNTVTLFPGVREHLHELMENRLRLCENCFCRWSCAGDCYVRSFGINPDGQVVYGGRCEMNRELTAYRLLHMISESGGVWKKFRINKPGKAASHG
jgi:uncharacterized protein